jgi:polyferredoxin
VGHHEQIGEEARRHRLRLQQAPRWRRIDWLGWIIAPAFAVLTYWMIYRIIMG